MKYMYVIIFFIIISCKPSYRDKDMAERVFRYHIGVVENFIRVGYIDNDTPLRNSMLFLEKLTKMKGDISEQMVTWYTPTKHNVRDWRKWYRNNKDRLYWDDEKQELKVSE
ncbi:hypothetical protein ACLI09_16505 [Flavobacterium sp. RHBU_24]|uniref:hypothetical protein n=1 Tax=Flavobacterium sp. RHBU_24 TaxID=3391185 RepID=UPI0039850374